MTAHALTHETDNGIDVYSMPASTTNPVELPIAATDNPNHYDLVFESIEPALFSGFTGVLSKASNIFKYLISGRLSNTNIFSAIENSKDYVVKIKDKFNAVGSKLFKLKVLNQKPIIDRIYCYYTSKTSETDNADKLYFSENILGNNITARANKDFYCTIEAIDPDSNAITGYSAENMPAGLTFTGSQLIGPITASANNDYLVSFYVYDEYGLKSDAATSTITLSATYCGDGEVQFFGNSEGFVEDCEIAGTGESAASQYSCTNCKWGGEYCGDGVCQSDHICAIDCSYWRAGNWSDCHYDVNGVYTERCGSIYMTRTVSCIDQNGNIVSDSYCSRMPKPATLQSCFKSCWTYVVGCGDSDGNIICKCDGVSYGTCTFCGASSVHGCFDGERLRTYCREIHGSSICGYPQ